MARIVVIDDKTIYMDEDIRPAHLDDEHSALQLIERLAWAIDDANREAGRPLNVARDYRHIPAG